MTKRYQWTSAAPEPQCGERPKWVKTRAEAHRATMATEGPNQGLIAPTRQRRTPREGTSLVSAVGNQATTPRLSLQSSTKDQPCRFRPRIRRGIPRRPSPPRPCSLDNEHNRSHDLRRKEGVDRANGRRRRRTTGFSNC